MKIAQIAPLIESVPPRLYGGTERIVSYLTEALITQGHDVTLFASGDSVTRARLLPCCPQALRLDPTVHDPIPYYMLMLSKVRRMAAEFDLLHFHIDQLHFPIFEDVLSPAVLTTVHGRQDLPDIKTIYAGFPNMKLVAISEAQRRMVACDNFVGTVHHGLPIQLLTPSLLPRGGYVAFLGRISPEKRVDRAIAIARAVGVPIKISAKIDRTDEAYFRSEIEPLLRQPGVEFLGEIDERRKGDFLRSARALLFPIDWPEPFGLVTIEAMACGTPVLAFDNGAVREVVDEGVTGCIVRSVEEAICKLGAVMALDRGRVRRRFEERFSASRMATDYVKLYRRMIGRASQQPVPVRDGLQLPPAEPTAVH